eukprot:184412_1
MKKFVERGRKAVVRVGNVVRNNAVIQQAAKSQNLFNYESVYEGNKSALWNEDGTLEIIDGPKRVYVGNGRLSSLSHYKASSAQYLHIEYKDGTIKRIAGPSSLWYNPLEHKMVYVNEMKIIGENEAMILYRQNDETQELQKHILTGPMKYIPSSNSYEYFHEFQWSYPTASGATGLATQGSVRFQKIRLLPSYVYFDVPNVRTSDDIVITVKSMIFYELIDLQKLMDKTRDPMLVMINALIADIIQYTSNKEFNAFKSTGHELNELETYPQLCVKANEIGFHISKIVFRGYESSDRLQSVHDDAMKRRIELDVDNEKQMLALKTEKEKFELKCEKQRRELELENERVTQEFKQKEVANEMQLSHLSAVNDEKLRYYELMKKNGIEEDIADIIRAEANQPSNKKVIQIDGDRSQDVVVKHKLDEYTRLD